MLELIFFLPKLKVHSPKGVKWLYQGLGLQAVASNSDVNLAALLYLLLFPVMDCSDFINWRFSEPEKGLLCIRVTKVVADHGSEFSGW